MFVISNKKTKTGKCRIKSANKPNSTTEALTNPVNKNKITFAFIFLLLISGSGNPSLAQIKDAPVKPKTTLAALTKAQSDIDSLNNVLARARESYENEIRINKRKDSLIEEMDAKVLKMQNINNDLEKKLTSYKGDNLKLDQSNRILIIFNAIVGILLLTTLVWFLRNIGKKKSPDKNKTAPGNEISITSNNKFQTVSKNDNQFFDAKLEQLEKLGVLREKGILNDDEFNRQKQQILGNS
ncbi:MAG: SHOCT domain-containing protein [Bacteroidia bacterium]